MTVVLPSLDDRIDKGKMIEIEGVGNYPTSQATTLLYAVRWAWTCLTSENVMCGAIDQEVREQIEVVEDARPSGAIKVRVKREVCLVFGDYIKAAAGKKWGVLNLPNSFSAEALMGRLSLSEIKIHPISPRTWTAFHDSVVCLAAGLGPGNRVMYIHNNCWGKMVDLLPPGLEILRQADGKKGEEIPRIERDLTCAIAQEEGLCENCKNEKCSYRFRTRSR